MIWQRILRFSPTSIMTILVGLFAFAVTKVGIAETPNVIVIYTDDQGFGDASCLNESAKFRTPNLDRLAREGITFTDAHSSDTVCTPSRYGLLTGRYSWRTSLKKGVFGAERTCLIADERMTIASLLRDHGYATAMVGKWHLGMDFPGEKGNRDWTQPVQDMPLDKGFDYFYGIPASMNYGVLAWFEGRYAAVPPTLYTAKKPNQMAISDYRIKPPYEATPQQTKQNLGVLGMETASDFVDSQCLTRFTDKALQWMKQHVTESNRGTPFLLYLPYTSPHKPVIPLPEFRGQGKAGAYGEFMIETDHHVGRILRFLDEQQIADNTLVVFTSDNGPETTWRKRQEKYDHHSNHIYREGKRSIYEGGHRVPFFVRWPKGITNPGRTWTGTVCQTDLLATLADIVGGDLPANAGEDSQSLLPILRSADANLPRQPTMHHAANGRLAIRDGDWKLCFAFGKQGVELYNLQADPSEANDVVTDHPDVVATLTRKATKLVTSGRSTAGIPQPNDTGHWNALTWIAPDQYEQQQSTLRKTTTQESGNNEASQVLPVPDDLRTRFSLDEFYQQHVMVGELPVVGSKQVSKPALLEAAWIVDRMIGHRPEILRAMAKNNTRLAVMAWNEFTTDVPEHRELKPAVYWDRRARGLGATPSAPAVSCAEENLLGHPNDPYSTENICIHEFAHAIHIMGMPEVDPTFEPRLQLAYDRAIAAGLWKETYAATDIQEYWAESVQSWFDDNRENDALHNHVNTRAELKSYDAGVAALCNEVFGDRQWKYQKPNLRNDAGRAHLGTLDLSTLPKFQWRKAPIPDKPRVRIRTTLGPIEVELDAKAAPVTVANFLHYVHEGLYADGFFHRTVRADNQPDDDVRIAVIQAQADPSRSGEFRDPIPLERTSETGLKHVDGAISMAREADPDTGQHHFFICVGDQPELDFGGKRERSGQGFAAFGVVTKGMDVVRKIHQSAAEGQSLEPAIRIQRSIRLN